ncbi:hypothetical protein BDV93DRAFT_562196 [Ceratobasidium sp. AG-I]|nr:hypothetical protein BDV93DRAFT_562196 [Ceratobasidium sp. AG-I]
MIRLGTGPGSERYKEAFTTQPALSSTRFLRIQPPIHEHNYNYSQPQGSNTYSIKMSLRPHFEPPVVAQQPEIHHPRPTRPAELQRRVTISVATEEDSRGRAAWPHYTPAAVAPNTNVNEKVDSGTEAAAVAERVGRPPARAGVGLRSPSAPPALNYSLPTPTIIHSLLTVPSALRSRSRPRLGWDVRYSPDTPTPTARQNFRYSTGGLGDGNAAPIRTRPRSNTQPQPQAQETPELKLATDLSARLNHNYNSHPQPASPTTPLSPVRVSGPGGVFSGHPVALEPATNPPRGRMLIVCRDLLPWITPIHARDPDLIPIYASNPDLGCTVLDVVRGIFTALQKPVEVTGHAQPGAPVVESKRVDRLRDKTVFVCLGRDEALARRRLPGRASLWSEVFVLTLARRER